MSHLVGRLAFLEHKVFDVLGVRDRIPPECLVIRMSSGGLMQGVLRSVCGLLDCFGCSRGKVFGSGEARGEKDKGKISVDESV